MAAATPIAVFGSSEPRPGEAAYEIAVRLGRLLAEAGHAVITGGYGGVMEAASRGAREAGGHTIGVPCAIFRDRAPNAFLVDTVMAPNLFERSRVLIERAAGFVVLPGKAGTLSELALLWALERAGCLEGRRVILLGRDWEPLVELLFERAMLEDRQRRMTFLATDPADAVRQLAGSGS